jgi:cytochrome P450
VGPQRIYLVTHPDGVRRVLHDHDGVYAGGDLSARFRRLFGAGLLTSWGPAWARHRPVLERVFDAERAAGDVALAQDGAARMAAAWRSRAGHGPLDVLADLEALGREVGFASMFGPEAVVPAEVHQAFQAVIAQTSHAPLVALDLPFWLPTPRNRAFLAALERIDRFVHAEIARRRAQAPGGPGLLDALVHGPGADGTLSATDLRDHVVSILVSELEQPPNSLGWFCRALAEHPEVAARVAAEVRAASPGDLQTVEGLERLAFTRQSLDETLRLRPPAWIIARRVAKTHSLAGQEVAEGAQVLLCPYALHRDPRFWTDPERFDPGRFAPEEAARRVPYSYLPFSGGPRSCLGAAWARLQQTAIAAQIARAVSLAPAGDVRAEGRIQLRPVPGIRLHATAL